MNQGRLDLLHRSCFTHKIRSLPTPVFRSMNRDQAGPSSLPAMVNLLNVNNNDKRDIVMRTSTKVRPSQWSVLAQRELLQIINGDLRDKYQHKNSLDELPSPISSPLGTIESSNKIGMSPIPAARLISPTKKQARDSFANAMRNKHWLLYLYQGV